MDMESALMARLLAAAPVTALTGQRIYWDMRPQNSVLPDITLQFIVDSREQHMGGFQGLRSGLVQADVRATTFAQKKLLKDVLIVALEPAHTGNGIKFNRATRIVSRPLNEWAETRFIYRDAIDFFLHFSDAA